MEIGVRCCCVLVIDCFDFRLWFGFTEGGFVLSVRLVVALVFCLLVVL